MHSYDVGTRAWQPDPSEGWIASQVQSKKVDGDKVSIVFQLENGTVRDSFEPGRQPLTGLQNRRERWKRHCLTSSRTVQTSRR